MPEYLIRSAQASEPARGMKFLDFRVHTMRPRETVAGAAEGKEVGITILYGICDIEIDGIVAKDLGKRVSIEAGCSPHVTLIPPESRYAVTAVTEAKITVSRTDAGGGLREPVHILAGAANGKRRGVGKTERTIYDLIPPDVDTKLMIYEVFTPAGNWSSFPPHKHDEDTQDERALEEVYLFHFTPPEGFALIWLFDDAGETDHAYAARNGDLALIPKGYHTMAVSPGYVCATHAVMAGTTNEWKIKFKEEYKHLYDWDK